MSQSQQNLVKFDRLSRVQQNLVEYGRIQQKNGKLPQIAVDYGNLVVGLQLLSRWKQVDVCKVLRRCLVIGGVLDNLYSQQRRIYTSYVHGVIYRQYRHRALGALGQSINKIINRSTNFINKLPYSNFVTPTKYISAVPFSLLAPRSTLLYNSYFDLYSPQPTRYI